MAEIRFLLVSYLSKFTSPFSNLIHAHKPHSRWWDFSSSIAACFTCPNNQNQYSLQLEFFYFHGIAIFGDSITTFFHGTLFSMDSEKLLDSSELHEAEDNFNRCIEQKYRRRIWHYRLTTFCLMAAFVLVNFGWYWYQRHSTRTAVERSYCRLKTKTLILFPETESLQLDLQTRSSSPSTMIGSVWKIWKWEGRNTHKMLGRGHSHVSSSIYLCEDNCTDKSISWRWNGGTF